MSSIPERLRGPLGELADLHENFDAAQLGAPGAGWNTDRYEVELPPEAPGEPTATGSFQAARTVLTGYTFPPPDLLRGYFDEGPLESRRMLLEGRFAGFKFHFGVGVSRVTDEERAGDDGSERVWGYAYRTLGDHFERGEIEFLVHKHLASGRVWLTVRAVSGTATIPNPLYRLGFAIYGRHLQRRFGFEGVRRVRRLVRQQLGEQLPEPIPSALPRPIVLSNPGNVAAVLTSLLAGALSYAGRRDLNRAAAAAGSTFCAWSLARELDPDRPLLANVSQVLALPLILRAPGDPVQGFAVVTAARLTAGTVGPAPTPPDTLAAGVLAGLSAWRGGWGAAGATVAALAWSSSQADDQAPGPLAALPAVLLAGVLGRDQPPNLLALGLAALTAQAPLNPVPPVSSPRDDESGPVSAGRVRTARTVAWLSLAAGVLGSRAVWPVAVPLLVLRLWPTGKGGK